MVGNSAFDCFPCFFEPTTVDHWWSLVFLACDDGARPGGFAGVSSSDTSVWFFLSLASSCTSCWFRSGRSRAPVGAGSSFPFFSTAVSSLTGVGLLPDRGVTFSD